MADSRLGLASSTGVDSRLLSRTPLELVVVGLFALGIWTEMDIVGAPIRHPRGAYNDFWYLGLVGLLVVLGVAYRSVALPFGVWLLSTIGGEDALYFYLQLRTPPQRLPWLDGHLLLWQPPTNVSVTAGLAAGVAALVALVLLERELVVRWRNAVGRRVSPGG